MKINDKDIQKEDFEKVNEKIFILLAVGCLEAISDNKVTIDEMDHLLFSPYICSIIKSQGYDERIIAITEECCFLEDYLSLIPEKLPSKVDSLKKEFLSLLPDYDEYDWFQWLTK